MAFTKPPIFPTRSGNPFLDIRSISFSDSQRGWLSAANRDEPNLNSVECVLRQSTDGGATWQARDTVQPFYNPAAYEWKSTCQVAFLSDQVGWVYNPGLFTTRDGGKHWKDEGVGTAQYEAGQTTGESIAFLTIARSTAWALRRSQKKGQDSQYQLMYFDLQKGWLPAPVQPLPPENHVVDMVAGPDGKIWILSGFGRIGEPAKFQLLVSSDQSKTWQVESLPNDLKALSTIRLRVRPDGTLWQFVNAIPPASEQKGYILPAGSHTWKKLCAVGASSPFDYDPCLVGHGETFLVEVASNTTAFQTEHNGSLTVTRDGGWHWSLALPYDYSTINGVIGWFGDIFFLDASHGWVSYLSYILSTTDGGQHWSYYLVQ